VKLLFVLPVSIISMFIGVSVFCIFVIEPIAPVLFYTLIYGAERQPDFFNLSLNIACDPKHFTPMKELGGRCGVPGATLIFLDKWGHETHRGNTDHTGRFHLFGHTIINNPLSKAVSFRLESEMCRMKTYPMHMTSKLWKIGEFTIRTVYYRYEIYKTVQCELAPEYKPSLSKQVR